MSLTMVLKDLSSISCQSYLYKTFGMLVSDVHVYPVFTTEDKILA